MDARSEANLAQVHPDLARVIRQAAESQPFVVICGLRTPEAEAANVADGASQTLHSRHLANARGLACAVDVAALDDGHISWEPALYARVWNAVRQAGESLGVPVQWGGAWETLKDWGHFQLPWSLYP